MSFKRNRMSMLILFFLYLMAGPVPWQKLIKSNIKDINSCRNVCYIKHFYLSLHPIKYNYGEEYIW